MKFLGLLNISLGAFLMYNQSMWIGPLCFMVGLYGYLKATK